MSRPGTAAWLTLVRTVTVPQSGSRRISFVLPVPFNPRGLVVKVIRADAPRQAGDPIGSDALLARQEVDLREASVVGGLVAVVSSELAFDWLALRSGDAGQARVAYPHPQNLPESWAAYDCVDAVIVRDTSSHRLRPSQADALRKWVFAGGTLVFTGGAPGLMLSASGLGELVPVEVTGREQAAARSFRSRRAGCLPGALRGDAGRGGRDPPRCLAQPGQRQDLVRRLRPGPAVHRRGGCCGQAVGHHRWPRSPGRSSRKTARCWAKTRG